MSKRKKK